MATVSIQDDANMVRYRPLFELIEESAFVNPIKKTQEQRCGRGLIRWPPLRGTLFTVEPAKGGSFVRWFVKGKRSRTFANWAQSGIHLVHPTHCPQPLMPNNGTSGQIAATQHFARSEADI